TFDLGKLEASVANIAALKDAASKDATLNKNLAAVFSGWGTAPGPLTDVNGNPTAYGQFLTDLFTIVNPKGATFDLGKLEASVANIAALKDAASKDATLNKNLAAVFFGWGTAIGPLTNADGSVSAYGQFLTDLFTIV